MLYEVITVSGLAEFGHRNGLDVPARVNFSTPGPGADLADVIDIPELPERALVAVGGGKDSLVALELLRHADIELQPACVGDSKLIRATVSAAGLPLLQLRPWHRTSGRQTPTAP